MDGDVRWYEPLRLRKEGAKITVIKPHGSIEWYLMSRRQRSHHIDTHAIPGIADVDHCRDITGRMIDNIGSSPQFLSGGMKELIYHSGIYADMQSAMLNALDISHRILMSGFGWNDLGISLRLQNWLDRNPERKIILLHKNPDKLRQYSRGLRLVDTDSPIRRRQLLFVNKWFSETKLDDIMPMLREE